MRRLLEPLGSADNEVRGWRLLLIYFLITCVHFIFFCSDWVLMQSVLMSPLYYLASNSGNVYAVNKPWSLVFLASPHFCVNLQQLDCLLPKCSFVFTALKIHSLSHRSSAVNDKEIHCHLSEFMRDLIPLVLHTSNSLHIHRGVTVPIVLLLIQ